MNQQSIRRIAEKIADELLTTENEIRAETEQAVWDWWLGFLREQGQVKLWRKAIITRHILIREGER